MVSKEFMVALNNKTRIIIVVAVLLSGWFWLPPHLKSETEVTIDSLSFSEYICGEDISKEDLQDHVVGVKYWGKW